MENLPAPQWTFPNTEEESHRYQVFKCLYEKGYYLTSGFGFGGNYAVYPADPLKFHAEYIVRVCSYEQQMSSLSVVTFGRLAVGVRKGALLASVLPSGDVRFLAVSWQGVT